MTSLQDTFRPCVPIAPRRERQIVCRPSLARDPRLIPKQAAEAFARCRSGADPWPLFLHGDVGTGKTRFGLLVHDFFGGYWCDFSDLLAEFVAMRKGELTECNSEIVARDTDCRVSERSWFDHLGRWRLTIVDDVGRKGDTQAATARDLLARLLDRREGSPTLIISNLEPRDLVAAYDDRVASRLVAGTVVGLVGRDRRLGRK